MNKPIFVCLFICKGLVLALSLPTNIARFLLLVFDTAMSLVGIGTGNPGYSQATHTPTPAYPYPQSGVWVLTDAGCRL